MPTITDNLTWDDMTTLQLRALYERYGYGRYRMGKFEPYDMYLENRNFLKSETVITFTDASGKLMALKPDVTMSIVKNTPVDAVSRKLYYVENVFRMAPGSREYREISQIGIESIGCGDLYSEAEVLLLALKTLETISPDYVLCVGDMGFADAALRACGLSGEDYESAVASIRRKSTGAVSALADRLCLPEEKRKLLLAVAETSAPMMEAVAALEALELPEEASGGLATLRDLCGILTSSGYGDRLRVDFSLINDMDYYNGVVFQGYIPGAPRAVLSGGRYDNLMRRFGKPQSAVGFALYSGELSRMFGKTPARDVDVLVVYGGASPKKIRETVLRVSRGGKSVRTERHLVPGIRAGETVILDEREAVSK